jgi:integrase
MRRGEILALDWQHIDLTARSAHIPITKTNTPRTIPLTTRAVSILKEAGTREGVVFAVSADAIKGAWKRARRNTNLIGLRFHDLRHEAISRLFELGLNTPEVALVSGHKDPRMLFRYTHLSPGHVRDRIDHLASNLDEQLINGN